MEGLSRMTFSFLCFVSQLTDLNFMPGVFFSSSAVLEGAILFRETFSDFASSTSEPKVIFEMSLVANSCWAPFLNAILNVYSGEAWKAQDRLRAYI